MNDFHGLLSSDFGFNPQGKSTPMAPPKPKLTTNSAFNFEIGGTATARPGSISKSSSGPFLGDHDTLFRPNDNRKYHEFSDLGGFDDAFGGNNSKTAGTSSVNLDSIFTGSGDSGPKFSSLPVYDKPVFDDDAFDGVSGLKSSNSAKHEDILSSSSKKNDAFDDLLRGLGRKEPEPKGFTGSGARGADKGIPGFDDLLPGFGGNSAQSQSTSSDSSWHHRSTAHATKKTSSAMDDPFVVLESTSSPAPSSSGFFNDPLGKISNLNSSNTKSASGDLFDEIDHLDGLGKTVPAFKSEMNDEEKEGSHLRTGRRAAGGQNSASVEASDKSHGRSPHRVQEKRMPAEDFRDSPRNLFDMPSVSADSHRSVPNAPPLSYRNASSGETNAQEQTSPKYEENLDSSEDIWLIVSEIPLFTQPTAAPPPARPPPPRPARFFRAGAAAHAKKKVDEYSAFPSSTMFFPSAKSVPDGEKNSFVSPIDEQEDFSMGKSQNNVHGSSDVLTGEDMETNSAAAASAAAMKEAMDRAEAKFRHAKEVRERENAKAARIQQERGEKTVQDARKSVFRESQERLERERQQREREEEERGHKEEERWQIERERRRLERERDLARQAVERATREARERAAAEARARAERAAVEKAQAEARERAERAAVQRVQAEARERAAREAKEKAEKAAAESRERDKEARERAAAAAAAKANQQKNEYDLDSLLSMGSRPSSAPRPRASHSDPVFDTQFQSKQAKESVRAFDGSTANMRKASLPASMVDDLNSIFGASPSAEEFQEVEGESEERQRARLERHQRTQERARKALEEKNQRDRQAQMEQAERHRIAETLDAEIKKWATGKEGNLRALLSTLHNVLWPECGWQPAPITDLITAASVKKVYRKATLSIHPDKVQQKGATLQQKYIAEKVFDILKEAWNKFNSEELF